jgi:hypothetical protein
MIGAVKDTCVADRFWSKVDNTDGCWIWTAAKDKDGYGLFFPSKGRTARAHRFAYEHLIGSIPDGLCLDHLCRERACVNPMHLEPVTVAENIRRGETGRWQVTSHCPEGHPYSGSNLYINPSSGGRVCRICRREGLRRWRKSA